jgi:hypothetical protein
MINSRADLDAIRGTPAYDEFMKLLAGSIYRYVRNEDLKQWDIVQDTTSIERFGFAVGDFDVKPSPPEYKEPYVAPVVSVTMRQARLALLSAGLLDDVESAIADIEDQVQRKAAEIEWEYAQTVNRDSQFTMQLAEGLGLTEEQLNNLFTVASSL